jgi:hypothetical protein
LGLVIIITSIIICVNHPNSSLDFRAGYMKEDVDVKGLSSKHTQLGD